jgi:hypothetical protein
VLQQVVRYLKKQRRVDDGLNRLLQAILDKAKSSELQAALKVTLLGKYFGGFLGF